MSDIYSVSIAIGDASVLTLANVGVYEVAGEGDLRTYSTYDPEVLEQWIRDLRAAKRPYEVVGEAKKSPR